MQRPDALVLTRQKLGLIDRTVSRAPRASRAALRERDAEGGKTQVVLMSRG